MNFPAIRDDILNRDVAIGFGLVVSFILILLMNQILDINPFGSLLSQLLVIPGYVVMLGFTILRVNLFPNVGPPALFLALGLYLVCLSVLLGWLIRTIRQAVVWARTR